MPSLREVIAGLLRDGEYEAVLGKIRKDRGTVRTLTGLLYHDEELVRWRAVTMFGHLAAAEPEMVRPVIKRLLWFLNEESSTVGWGSAQAIGEIARRDPGLAREAVRVVVHLMDDEESCRPANRNTYILTGIIWAIGDLAVSEPGLTREMGPMLTSYLGDPDPQVRAHAAWALGRIGFAGAAEGLDDLLGDEGEAELYIGEELIIKKISVVAAEALESIGGGAPPGGV